MGDRLRTAPGPRGKWLLGSLLAYKRDPLDLFLRAAREHGGLARLRMAHVQVFLVSGPEHIQHVLLGEGRSNYVKGVSYESLSTILGQGLLTAEGEVWRRQRRLMNPDFKRRALAHHIPAMAGSVRAAIERWRTCEVEGRQVDGMEEGLKVALDIVLWSLFGADLSEADRHLVEEVMPTGERIIYERMEAVVRWPLWVPTPANLRLRRIKRVVGEVVERMIARHREQEGGDDLLSKLIAARDEETNEGMDDQQLMDECLTLLFAGHETSAQAIAWTLHLLARNPEAQERLAAEVREVVGDREPAADDLERLTYTAQVVDESLRLYPPAYAFTRRPLADDVVGGYHVPRGSMVVVSPWVNHRLESNWPDPERFDPERFAPGRAKERPPHAYIPFGVGQHMCIGKEFSLLEVRLAVAMLVQAYRLRPAAEPPVELWPQMTLKARHGIPLLIEART